jgi:hypothetical protein
MGPVARHAQILTLGTDQIRHGVGMHGWPRRDIGGGCSISFPLNRIALVRSRPPEAHCS